jgi:hypothetical protein
LTRAVLDEWNLLLEQRRIFNGLKWDSIAGDDLYSSSLDRFAWRLSAGASAPRREIAISRDIVQRADAHEINRRREILTDTQIRARQIREGRVVRGRVARIIQPRPNFHPCSVLLTTMQEMVRFRRDQRVEAIDAGGRCGHVRRIGYNSATGRTEIEIELSKGVRGASVLAGTDMEWFESDQFPLYLKTKPFDQAAQRNSWLVTGTSPPPRPQVRAGSSITGSLVEAANRLRAGSQP